MTKRTVILKVETPEGWEPIGDPDEAIERMSPEDRAEFDRIVDLALTRLADPLITQPRGDSAAER